MKITIVLILIKTEGNQGIEEHLRREKVSYCKILKELSVRGNWLANYFPKNVTIITLQLTF